MTDALKKKFYSFFINETISGILLKTDKLNSIVCHYVKNAKFKISGQGLFEKITVGEVHFSIKMHTNLFSEISKYMFLMLYTYFYFASRQQNNFIKCVYFSSQKTPIIS